MCVGFKVHRLLGVVGSDDPRSTVDHAHDESAHRCREGMIWRGMYCRMGDSFKADDDM